MDLEKEFSGKLSITSEGTRTVTGFFEVSVGDTLVHSKRHGDGYVDTNTKTNKIKNFIRQSLHS